MLKPWGLGTHRTAGDERLRRADAGEEFQCAEPGDEQAQAHPEDVDAVGDHALGDPLERACGGAEVAAVAMIVFPPLVRTGLDSPGRSLM